MTMIAFPVPPFATAFDETASIVWSNRFGFIGFVWNNAPTGSVTRLALGGTVKAVQALITSPYIYIYIYIYQLINVIEMIKIGAGIFITNHFNASSFAPLHHSLQ